MPPFCPLALIREVTRPAHEELEARLHISRPDVDSEAFQLYLRSMYGWLAPVESILWDESRWPDDFDVTARNVKAGWLEEDLVAAGGQQGLPEVASAAPWLTENASFPERLGSAYVIEGAQLGGQVLRRRLEGKVAPWPSRWLLGYGDQTGTMWRAFVEGLKRALVPERDANEAAKAAAAAFSHLTDWLEHTGAAGP